MGRPGPTREHAPRAEDRAAAFVAMLHDLDDALTEITSELDHAKGLLAGLLQAVKS